VSWPCITAAPQHHRLCLTPFSIPHNALEHTCLNSTIRQSHCLCLLPQWPCQSCCPLSLRTPWDKINVEFLVEETKKLAKEVKTLNKAVRNYEVYRLLEESLKAMLTSLPLVQVSTQSHPPD
jgi:hypothetical protein